MGRGDNRRTLKMHRRAGQRRKKERLRKLQSAIAERADSAAPPPKAPAAANPKSNKVAIKRSGQRKTAAGQDK